MNLWVGHGNVGSDPDVKILQSGKKVAKFNMATNKSFTNKQGKKVTETQWHSIILWEKLAELAEKYIKKGSSLIIEGEISYRSYENKEGQKVYITEIIGHNMHFAGSKKEDEKPKNNKIETGSMSNINTLPGIIESAENDPSCIPENYNEDNQPF